jgi:inner membrane transporter RhtA
MANRLPKSGAPLTMAAMVCVQSGYALSAHLIDHVGAAATAWLRLAWAGLLIFAVTRPRRDAFSRRTLRWCLLLGVVNACNTILFMEALQRIPLGTASALQFMGPLAVALLSDRRSRLAWPLIAVIGIVLMTQPWSGLIPLQGVAFATGAAVCFGSYIHVVQRVGDGVSGLHALSVSMPVAAVVGTLTVGPAAFGRVDTSAILMGLGLAVLFPLLTYILELSALRRMTTAAFGIMLSLEPALSLVFGAVLLDQVPTWQAVTGMFCVVVASIAAARNGSRPPGATTRPPYT